VYVSRAASSVRERVRAGRQHTAVKVIAARYLTERALLAEERGMRDFVGFDLPAADHSARVAAVTTGDGIAQPLVANLLGNRA
jgi:hypothetical protein